MLRRRSDSTETDPGGNERVDPIGQPVLSDPHAVAGSHDEEDGTNTNSSGLEVHLADLSLQPDELVPVLGRMSRDDQGGGEADVNEGEVGQSYLDPHQPVEVVIGSGRSREGGDADEEKVKRVVLSSTTSVPHIPKGM